MKKALLNITFVDSEGTKIDREYKNCEVKLTGNFLVVVEGKKRKPFPLARVVGWTLESMPPTP